MEMQSMNEVMTVEQIHEHFDSEWVLLEDPEVNEKLEVLGGRVLCHSKDRDEVYQKAIELSPTHSAFLYTGSFPEGEAFAL